MKLSSAIVAIVVSGVALAQNEPLMRGHASLPGVEVSFETRLEPATPPFADKFVGGTVTDGTGIHRYMAYNALHTFFGYDLRVERQPLGYAYDVVFRPLSISPASLQLEDPPSWTIIALSGYPAPQTVRSGATIALDLFVNPATKQKLVEYIRFQEGTRLPTTGHSLDAEKQLKALFPAKPYVIGPGDWIHLSVMHHPDLSQTMLVSPDGYISIRFAGQIKAGGLTTVQLSATITNRLKALFLAPQVNVQVVRINGKRGAETPRDFSLEDVELRIGAPRISVDGKPLPITANYNGSVSGRVVWFYLPERGRYNLSLLPHESKGFTKADGEVQGGRLTFTIDNETLELLSNAAIAPGNAPYNVYVRHDSAWQPKDPATLGNFLLGSADAPDNPEVVQVSNMAGGKCYISGEVVRPGAYPLTGPKTVFEALNEAGGLKDFAKASKIYVLRGQEKISFNYRDVRMGKNLGQNIRLRNGDVIVVP